VTPLLELRGVTKRYGGFRALRGVDMALAHGESVALLGPNGAGKTTLLRIVAGLVRPSGGDVLLEGRPALAEPQALRRRLGHVSHHSMLHEALTARENLAFAGRLYDVKQLRTRIDQLLRSLDLIDRGDEPVRQLSRGMQQRIAIARSLLHDPDLLILDEPYTGLDRASGAAFTSLLASLRRRGRTLLLVTHDPDRALEVAERVVVLRLGRVVAERSTSGLSPAELEDMLAGAASHADADGVGQ
jgi:heme exporter protein A